MPTWREKAWKLALPVMVAAMVSAIFCLGITWGLPSRGVDQFLFGDEQPWSGEKIHALTGDRPDDPARGADVDIDPLTDRDEIIVLNETDEQRAEIIRRYRLFSYHPDEMVTFMALGRMNPGAGDLDPKLYQYGGLWIYSVGALLKAASLVGAVTLTADPVYYLDCPEAFGRFYVVARLFVVAWGVVGVFAVYWLIRRLTSGADGAAVVGAACFAFMPVVINGVHEAKPHLPGAVLTLLTVMAAMRFLDTRRAQWWWMTSMLAGAAVGMVLNAWPALTVIPMTALLRKASWSDRIKRTLAGGVIAFVVYAVTNPYVIINLATNRELLRSNLANTRAMFEIGSAVEAFGTAVFLIREGASLGLALVGAIGTVSFAVAGLRCRRPKTAADDRASSPVTDHLVWLLVIPAVCQVIPFALFAAGQGGEYGRFIIYTDIVLALSAVTATWRFLSRNAWRGAVAVLLVLGTSLPGYAYLQGFMADRSSPTTRTQAAERLDRDASAGVNTLAVWVEPAPYAVPPVDLFHWKLLLMPRDRSMDSLGVEIDAGIRAVDVVDTPTYIPLSDYLWGPRKRIMPFGETEMSWAAKPFVWFILKDHVSSPGQEDRHELD